MQREGALFGKGISSIRLYTVVLECVGNVWNTYWVC